MSEEAKIIVMLVSMVSGVLLLSFIGMLGIMRAQENTCLEKGMQYVPFGREYLCKDKNGILHIPH